MNRLSIPEQTKPTVLVVDDEAGPRDALRIILRPFFNIQVADTAKAALEILGSQRIDLIALDQKLPDRQGMDVLQDIKHQHGDVEVIIITGYGSVRSAMEGFRHGAAGYLLKPFNVTDLLTLVNQTLEKKRCLDYLRKSFLESPNLWGAELESTRAWQALKAGHGRLSANASGGAIDSGKESDMMALFSDLLDATDRQLLNHSSRVSGYASLIGTRLNLTDHEQRALTLGAFLHDIGKIRPTSTDVQGTRVRFSLCEDSFDQHPLVGARIVSALGLPSEVSQIVSCHHERWDGSGYPRRVRGERIPFLARIVGIAEAFDHLTGQLFGRAPLTIDDAILRISLESHTRFDPVLIDIFIEVLSKYKTSLPHMSISSPLESGEPQIVATVRATR